MTKITKLGIIIIIIMHICKFGRRGNDRYIQSIREISKQFNSGENWNYYTFDSYVKYIIKILLIPLRRWLASSISKVFINSMQNWFV